MIWDEQLLVFDGNRVRFIVVFCGRGRLEDTLEAAEDTAIDIPHIWLYLAELITPMLHEGGISMGQLFRWAICRKSPCSFGLSDTFSLVNTLKDFYNLNKFRKCERPHTTTNNDSFQFCSCSVWCAMRWPKEHTTIYLIPSTNDQSQLWKLEISFCIDRLIWF